MSTVWLLTVAEADKAIRDHIETTFFYDEETGELWEPTLSIAWPDTDDDDTDDDLDG